MITTINEFKKHIGNHDFEYQEGPLVRKYFIVFEGIDYEISFRKNDYNDFKGYDSVAFKVKIDGEYFYDFDKVINTNNWSRFSKLLVNVIKHDFTNNNIDGYSFSTMNNKKGNQRILLYKRLITSMGCKILKEYDEQNKIIFTL